MQGSPVKNELTNQPSIFWLGLIYKITLIPVKREHDFEGEVKDKLTFENDSGPILCGIIVF